MNIELNFDLPSREPQNHGKAEGSIDSYTEKVNRLWQIGEQIKELEAQQQKAKEQLDINVRIKEETQQKAKSNESEFIEKKASGNIRTYTAIITDIKREREELEEEKTSLLEGRKLH